jgi:hypothetical protein
VQSSRKIEPPEMKCTLAQKDDENRFQSSFLFGLRRS